MYVQVLVTWCCGHIDKRAVRNVAILEHILLDWRIWHRTEEEVNCTHIHKLYTHALYIIWEYYTHMHCVQAAHCLLYSRVAYLLQVWQGILWQLQKLLSPEEAGETLDANIECFHRANSINKILLTSKVQQFYMKKHICMYAHWHNIKIARRISI